MKRCLLVLCLALSMLGKAQSLTNDKQQDLIGRGHINVGFSIGQGYRGTYPTTTFVSPRVQYFITDGWSIAAEGRYLVSNIYPQTIDKPDYRLQSGGLSTRYYFLHARRLAVFAHSGAFYGESSFRGKSDAPVTYSRVWQTEVGLGAHYRVSKRWSIEMMGSRGWLNNTVVKSSGFEPNTMFNRWQGSFGVNYYFRR